MACLIDGIPAHLHKLDKPEDKQFSPEEVLYRRYPKLNGLGYPNLEASGKFKLSVFEFPCSPHTIQGLSCNRQKYSAAKDVLYNTKDGNHFNNDFAVMGASVGDIEMFVSKHPTEGFYFFLTCQHVPYDCMFPHSEIWIHRTDDPAQVFLNPALNYKVLKPVLRKYYSNLFKHIC